MASFFISPFFGKKTDFDAIRIYILKFLWQFNVPSVYLTHAVIICSRHKAVDEINAECLKHIEGTVHEYVAIDTDTNGQPLREADRQRLSRTAMRLPDILTSKEGC